MGLKDYKIGINKLLNISSVKSYDAEGLGWSDKQMSMAVDYMYATIDIFDQSISDRNISLQKAFSSMDNTDTIEKFIQQAQEANGLDSASASVYATEAVKFVSGLSPDVLKSLEACKITFPDSVGGLDLSYDGNTL